MAARVVLPKYIITAASFENRCMRRRELDSCPVPSAQCQSHKRRTTLYVRISKCTQRRRHVDGDADDYTRTRSALRTRIITDENIIIVLQMVWLSRNILSNCCSRSLTLCLSGRHQLITSPFVHSSYIKRCMHSYRVYSIACAKYDVAVAPLLATTR